MNLERLQESFSGFTDRYAVPFDPALALAFANEAEEREEFGDDFLFDLESDALKRLPRCEDRLNDIRVSSLREAMRWRGLRVMTEQWALC